MIAYQNVNRIEVRCVSCEKITMEHICCAVRSLSGIDPWSFWSIKLFHRTSGRKSSSFKLHLKNLRETIKYLVEWNCLIMFRLCRQNERNLISRQISI